MSEQTYPCATKDEIRLRIFAQKNKSGEEFAALKSDKSRYIYCNAIYFPCAAALNAVA
jgi:hypothetical protein